MDIAASATEAANRIDDMNSRIDLLNLSLNAQTIAVEASARALNDLTGAATRAAAAQAATTASTAASGNAARVAFGWWGALFGRVSLFGGAATISGLHLAVDVIAEISAVVIPAGVALAAFGVAASDAIDNVVRHFTDLHTVMDATGTAIWPMTGALEALHNAVQPDVYQILGDALLVANTRVGEFNKLATGTGQVLDQLAARTSIALESAGVSKFLDNAIPDVAKLGDIIGNIFGIVGNLLKTMPGYAEVLLNVVDAITGGFEWWTSTPVVQFLTKVTLGLHGLVIYMGLAATAVLALQVPLTKLGSLIVTGALNVASWGESVVVAAKNGELLTGAMGLLSAVPVWGWVALGAAALAGLVFWLVNTKTATQQWIGQLQAGISSQQTWTGLVQSLGSAQQQVADQITQAYNQLARTQEYVTVYNMRTGASTKIVSAAYSDLQGKISDLEAAQSQFSAEQQLATTRLNDLGKQVGGTQAALGLMAQAHIKAADAATANSSAWAQDVQQVLALQEGLRAMADYAAGSATTSLQVLDQQASDQYAAIQKVNSAWDAFTQNMTGTQGSFDTVAQGYSTLTQNAGTFTATLGKLVASNKYAKTAIDALTPAGIALNQAFTEQVGNVSKLYDSWRTAGIANDLFTSGVKASIAPLLRYANGSQEATAQLVGLAEQAGYQGPASMKALVQWLGNTSGATQRLKDITDQATIQEALLSGAMHAQGNLIAGQLIGDINAAILKYDGVANAARAYGLAIAQDGRNSDAAHRARQTLIDDLIKSGKAAGDSKNQIAAMITKVLGIPSKRALQLVMTGTGSFTIRQVENAIGANPSRLPGFASGGYIRGPGGPVSDRVPALLSAGEYVVRAAAVAKYGTHMMEAINAKRYAGGGLVEGGNLGVLSGQFAVDSAARFQAAMASSLTKAMSQGLRQAMSAGVPGSVSSYANVVQTVLGMLGQPLTDLSVVLRQMTTESGGNPTIVNLSDINAKNGTPSVGLMQVIGPTFRAYAGPFAGIGPFEYGVSTNPLANIYAGLNYAIHRYGPGWTGVLGQGHGYASGGIISEPVAGIGLRSGEPYSFGENGLIERYTPGGGGREVSINIAEMNVRHESDVAIVAQRLSGMIRAASMGGGFVRP